jgi:hypothetical protein
MSYVEDLYKAAMRGRSASIIYQQPQAPALR